MEFVTIERHVELATWKQARHAAPEQRVLAGNTLLVRYVEDDQLPGVAEQNRENEPRRRSSPPASRGMAGNASGGQTGDPPG